MGSTGRKMSDEEATEETPPLTPVEVEYEPATGMPPEFCEYLPKEDFLRALPWLSANRSFEWLQANCKKYKGFDKVFDSQESLEKKLQDLSVSSSEPKAETKLLLGGKKKKEKKLEILIERQVRNKRKCITSVTGLDLFGIKLAETAELIMDKYKEKNIKEEHFYSVVKAKKSPLF